MDGAGSATRRLWLCCDVFSGGFRTCCSLGLNCFILHKNIMCGTVPVFVTFNLPSHHLPKNALKEKKRKKQERILFIFFRIGNPEAKRKRRYSSRCGQITPDHNFSVIIKYTWFVLLVYILFSVHLDEGQTILWPLICAELTSKKLQQANKK